MHVAFVSRDTVHSRETDATQRLHEVATGLADRGHDVTILCAPFWDAQNARQWEEDGVVYHAVTTNPDPGRSYAMRLPLALRKVDPEIIHGTADDTAGITASKYRSVFSGPPTVLEWYDQPVDGKNARKAIDRSERIFVPSRLVRTRLREEGVDGEKVSVIPNAVDYDLIENTEPAEQRDIVFARRLDDAANLDSMLLALAEYRRRGWSATVVGDGPARADYEQQARDLRIDDRIDFVGECDRERRVALYRSAHVFVQTARYCVFPTELLWALACGCVGMVEYHAESSAHEIVENRERGFRATSETEFVEAFQEAGEMERMDIDENFREFDRSRVLNQYVNHYRSLLDAEGML